MQPHEGGSACRRPSPRYVLTWQRDKARRGSDVPSSRGAIRSQEPHSHDLIRTWLSPRCLISRCHRTGEQGFDENTGDTVQSLAPAPRFSSAALTSQLLRHRHHTPVYTLDRATSVPRRECSASRTFTVSFLSLKSQSKCYCGSSEWPSLAAQEQARGPVTLSQHSTLLAFYPQTRRPAWEGIHASVHLVVCPSHAI